MAKTKWSHIISFIIIIALSLCCLNIYGFEVNTTNDGREIKWKTDTVTYLINTTDSPSGSLDALLLSMQTWTDVDTSSFTFIDGGTTLKNNHGEADGINIIDFGVIEDAGVLGQNTFWFYSSGEMIDSDIRFNTNNEWGTDGSSNKFDVQNVGTHELGHSLSLADLYDISDSDKTMYAYSFLGDTSQRTLHQDDIDGITYLYPANPSDTTAPSGSISINSGASYINSTSVTLSLSATDDTGVTGYYISESSSTPSASTSDWTSVTSTTSYNASVSYTLSSGDGNKTVYAWYKDATGNVSDTASDSIILDTTAPTVTISSPTSDITYSTTSSTISLGGSASDSTSGVNSVAWSNSSTGSSGTASGTTNWSVSNINLSEGSNSITVTATDNAGNAATDSITVTYSIPQPSPTPTPITPIATATPTVTSIPCTDVFEPNDNFDTAYGPLSSGESYEGKICSLLDKDYFKFDVTGRGYIELELSVPSDRDYDLYLYDPEETQIASSNFGTGNTETITQTVFTTGTYYIGVIGYEGDYDEDQTYILSGTLTATRQTPAPTVTPEVTATVTPSVTPTPTPSETGAIIGTVVDAVTSAPISNATVSTDTGGYSTTTNPSGRYALTNIKAGDYTLTATASGYAYSSQSITVTADVPTQANFSLSPLISPTPTPEPTGLCEVYGFVVDEYYKDLKGVSVGINGENYNNSTKTDEDGYFEFVDLVGGEYTITFEKKGYKRQTQEVSLEEGEEYDMGTIVMKQGFSGNIYGTVTDVESEPIKSAKVKLKSKGNATNVKRKEKTDKDGRFEFDDLEDGTYIIQANKKGYKKSKTQVKLEDGEEEEIEIVLEEK